MKHVQMRIIVAYIFISILTVFATNKVYSQDVAVTASLSPFSGCELGNEQIGVVVLNTSAVTVVGGSITVGYTIDNQLPHVTQVLGSNLGPGNTWNFNFGTLANLSACGPHEVKVYTSFAGDPNQANDTLVWIVQNDCTIIPGVVELDQLVCVSGNNGSLTLNGWTYGTITDWEYSEDGGTSWISTGETNATYNFNDITTETLFQVQIDGGFCPDDVSDFGTISIQQELDPADIIGDLIVCEDDPSGVLEAINTTGTIIDWEISDDGGTSWTSLGETTSTINYSVTNNISSFRVITDGGVCPSVISNPAEVTIQYFSQPGTVSGPGLVCELNPSGTLTVSGNPGNVVQWEYSTDSGATWNTINNTTTTENFNNLTDPTWFRVLSEDGVCPNIYTDIEIVLLEDATIPGVLSADTSVCLNEDANLSLQGNNGSILDWEFSNDGINWSSLANATNSHNTGSITATTQFRVVVQNGVCPAEYSNSVTVTALPLPVVNAGNDVTIFEGDTTVLTGTGGVTGIWTPGTSLSNPNSPTTEAFPDVTTTYTYSVIDNNLCVNSDQVTVTVEEPIPPIPPTPEPPILPFSVKNVITSNGDGFNDTWIIEGVENFPGTKVIVYNIYGKELYENDDYINQWEGTYNGKKLPNGTYFYVVIPGGTDDKLKGTLTIMGDE